MMNEEILKTLSGHGRRIRDLETREHPIARGVAVYNNANIAIPNITWTALTFNQERWDDAAFHSVAANTSRLTVPTGYDGWYVISGHISFASSAAGNARYIAIYLNGVAYRAIHNNTPLTGCDAHLSIAAVYYLAATDFVELTVYQDSGGNLNVIYYDGYSPEFRMVRV